MRRLVLLLAALTVLAAASPAAAEIVRLKDDEGRTMTFDVRAADADVEWYAAVLRAALHGNEIERVTVRIVPWPDIRFECGAGAAACYGGSARSGRIVVASGRSDEVKATLLHEYGHHVDASYAVPGVPEPNGTPSWWSARGMADLAARGEVARNYSLGWDRSIAEVYAEDYVQVHMSAPFRIRWLPAPEASVRDAIVADLGGAPPAAGPPTTPPSTEETEPSSQSVTVVRRGRLASGQSQTLPFGLLGPGRRVELRVAATRIRRGSLRVRVEMECDGRVVRALTAVRGVGIDIPSLGPGTCTATVRAAGTAAIAYRATLRLTRPAL